MKYDAIVIGSGITGGWAAKELCEKGLHTLLLERGRDVKHIQDYPTAFMNPWDFQNRLTKTSKDLLENPVQSTTYDEGCKHFFVNDKENPYNQDKPFWWIRGYQVGGRSLTWSRQCYRWSNLDFEANKIDGSGVDWPIRYNDIAPWYDYVEDFIGVSGKAENLNQLPDSRFLAPMQLNCIESYLGDEIRKKFPDRLLTIARVANLTSQIHGRGTCMNRNLCSRGCPYGAYFSSNSATLPAAFATGKLTLRPFSVVTEIIYDENLQKATGVRVVDAETLKTYEFQADIIFLNASTIGSAAILLNSVSRRFPNGLGNDSGELGHNLMDHHTSAGAFGHFEGFKDKYYKGRRPCGFLIPRFRNLGNEVNTGFLRGYNIQGHGERAEWVDRKNEEFLSGEDFKSRITHPGNWTVWMAGWGECLPYHNNRIYLSDSQKDKWGFPLIHVNFEFGDNEKTMKDDIKDACGEMLIDAGFKTVETFNYHKPGGTAIHEMGTARMGLDPLTSVLNKYNQIHAVKNVFVTDGSCMTSSACQSPSLTYMALTARACDYAVRELKMGNL